MFVNNRYIYIARARNKNMDKKQKVYQEQNKQDTEMYILRETTKTSFPSLVCQQTLQPFAFCFSFFSQFFAYASLFTFSKRERAAMTHSQLSHCCNRTAHRHSGVNRNARTHRHIHLGVLIVQIVGFE